MGLNGALSNFFAVAEQYPNLKVNQDFVYLQQQMVECEDRIAAGRRFYNGNVRAFNTRFDTFPSSMIANFGKFEKKEYYEVDDPQVRAAPSLKGAFDSLNEPVTPTPPLGMIQQQMPQAPSGSGAAAGTPEPERRRPTPTADAERQLTRTGPGTSRAPFHVHPRTCPQVTELSTASA